jgi:hypothetical protein
MIYRIMKVYLSSLLLVAISIFSVSAVGQAVNDFTPFHKSSKAIRGWASGCTIVRGLIRSDEPAAGYASFGSDSDALGVADNVVVSLGDGGVAVVTFSEPISNKAGPDFAIFENSFDGKYLEFAFVEVSSDSVKWVRFPSVSNIQNITQTGSFGTSDAGLVHNLAGRHPASFGTPFYLEDVSDSAGIDINNVLYIRIIDVVGSIDPQYGTGDSRGNIINDPWPTPFPSSGFDLDAVALLDISLVGIGDDFNNELLLYPNPASDKLVLKIQPGVEAWVRFLDLNGTPHTGSIRIDESAEISIDILSPGIYLAEIRYSGEAAYYKRFIKL